MPGRPRTPIGTFGAVNTRRRGKGVMAETRFRDADGRLRRVSVSASSAAAARRHLNEKLLTRPGFGNGGQLHPSSSFAELADHWLADLDLRSLAKGTRHGYREHFRLHVLPAFEHYTLAEITTARVEWFLKSQAAYSASRAKQSRTLLNLVFAFALRHDAIGRNPVVGTSSLPNPKGAPQALTLEQIAAIRAAAAAWRTEPGLPGPKSDGQVRDIIEVLLGTALRPGEVLALRPRDITASAGRMVVHVTGTVVQHKGAGAVRQDHPKTNASVRQVAVPDFAATVLRRRLADLGEEYRDRTVFASRAGGPLSPYNVRRTFRDFLKLAGLEDSGISLRWYRRTAATVIARGMGSDAAATFLGHTSTAITEGHYIEPDRTIDPTPAAHLEATFRLERPDRTLLSMPPADGEEEIVAMSDADAAAGDVA
jgi:integrase